MAATLRAPSDLQHWDHAQRPRSQPPPPQQQPEKTRTTSGSRKRSPNRIKAKPANPAVINSILESLDSPLSPSIVTLDENSHSDTQSNNARPQSADASALSVSSLTRSTSTGRGVELGRVSSFADQDGGDAINDAALPPTVYTSRPPSGLSHYNAPRTPSFTGSSEKAFRRASSIGSRTSSFSLASKEQGGSAKNKLSAESWVKQNSLHRESVETDMSKKGRRSLRRKSSQDTLRPKTRIELVPPAPQPIHISRAEQIIAKVSTPPPSISKRRLYLTDSSSNEEQSAFDSPAPIEEGAELESSPQTPAQRSIEELRNPRQRSPQKSPIVDSIPMRTSSLRQSHSKSPVPGKKRERKSKRSPEGSCKPDSKVDSVMETPSKSIPESSWADLGDDDGTVRRIRELQERRKSRLTESTAPPTQEDYIELPKINHIIVDAESVVGRRSEDFKRAFRRRQVNRASTEPPSKAHRLLGITDENLMPVLNGQQVNGNRTSSLSPDLARRQNLSIDDTKVVIRPATATSSPTPPLSLDYSYAQAVDALHGLEREISVEKQESPEPSPELTPEPSVRTSVQIQRSDIAPADIPSVNTTPVRQGSVKNSRRRLEKRWSTHPDLPLDFDKKKNRRKSMSDTRHTRQLDNELEPPLPRRDSVEIAVSEYLQNARLSRRIKHPLTGRVISFSEVGDPNGAAVFVCLGMGLTRYVSAFYDELATTLRLRLITVDRPGVGGSEPYPPTDRSGPLNWPDDVLAVCQHLGVAKFSMLAHSAGAIYSLATALILPHLIQGKVHLLAPWIPPSQLEAISHPTASAPTIAALPRSQRFLRVLPAPFLKAANSSFMTATSASLKPATKRKSSDGRPRIQRLDTPPSRGKDRPATRDGSAVDFNRRESLMLMDQFMPDLNAMENFPIPVAEEEVNPMRDRTSTVIMSATATPMDPSFEYAATALNAAEHTEKERKLEFTSRLTARTWELAVRDSNPATDLLVCLERHRDVGFRYTDVNREVVITHGSKDNRVPLANVKWLAEQMNRRVKTGAEDYSSEDIEPQSREGWDAVSLDRGGCEVRILEGEGHGLMASPAIMGDILTEIAGYWNVPGRGRTTM